jgi:hypothetical protein
MKSPQQPQSASVNCSAQGERGSNGVSFSARPAQMVTTITHGPSKTITSPTTPGHTLNVGTGMNAFLDPSDHQIGSKVSANLSAPLQSITVGSKRRYVQGHLLNSRVGGSGGDAQNLTPLSYSANSTHFHHVEKKVIEEVKKGNTVDYSVIPDYSKTPHASATGLESDLEQHFASSLNCSVAVNGTSIPIPPIANVPPYP